MSCQELPPLRRASPVALHLIYGLGGLLPSKFHVYGLVTGIKYHVRARIVPQCRSPVNISEVLATLKSGVGGQLFTSWGVPLESVRIDWRK